MLFPAPAGRKSVRIGWGRRLSPSEPARGLVERLTRQAHRNDSEARAGPSEGLQENRLRNAPRRFRFLPPTKMSLHPVTEYISPSYVSLSHADVGRRRWEPEKDSSGVDPVLISTPSVQRVEPR